MSMKMRSGKEISEKMISMKMISRTMISEKTIGIKVLQREQISMKKGSGTTNMPKSYKAMVTEKATVAPYRTTYA